MNRPEKSDDKIHLNVHFLIIIPLVMEVRTNRSRVRTSKPRHTDLRLHTHTHTRSASLPTSETTEMWKL